MGDTPAATANDVDELIGSTATGRHHADFLEILPVLAREKKRILQFALSATMLWTIIVFVMPKMYTATATILSPQQNQSVLSIMVGQVGWAAAPDLRNLGPKNPSDVFVAMLKSRSVEDTLVERFDLRKVCHVKRYQDARKILEKCSEVDPEKGGLISSQVSDRDPKRAAAIANDWVDELRGLNQNRALTEPARRRVFFEQKLAAEGEDLSKAELSLQQLQEKTGLIRPDTQARSLVGAVADLQAQIAVGAIAVGGHLCHRGQSGRQASGEGVGGIVRAVSAAVADGA